MVRLVFLLVMCMLLLFISGFLLKYLQVLFRTASGTSPMSAECILQQTILVARSPNFGMSQFVSLISSSTAFLVKYAIPTNIATAGNSIPACLMIGTIPWQSFNASYFHWFRAGSNYFEGTLPPTLHPKLMYVDLGNNYLTGTLPSHFPTQVLSLLDLG